MYKKISDYGIIGNLHSVALVGLDGSIDWLCFPRLDSPSVFGALLDDRKGGRFSIGPAGECESAAEYVPDTNVLVTRFRTPAGILVLTDFMPIPPSGGRGPEERHDLCRIAEVSEGVVDVDVLFEPRFDYARAPASVVGRGGELVARGNGESLAMSASRELSADGSGAAARWRMSRGDRVWMRLSYGTETAAACDPQAMETELAATVAFWRNWLKESETGRPLEFGRFEPMMNRSALALKLLCHDPAGTIAAAATTSLPEEIGGTRNWDYRYTWVRDTSFTLQALFNLGHLSETENYLRWVQGLLSTRGPEKLQIMYGLCGEEELSEVELPHLEGYRGSRPVRIGNGAATQRQLDIYGELMDAALKLSDYAGKIDLGLWPFLCGICSHVAGHWQEKDFGIWEARSDPRHYVHSKVMCWVALDRGLTIARRYGFPADLEAWEATRDAIRKEILEKGWNAETGSFVQHYEGGGLDSSALLIPHLGFLAGDDPRVLSTCTAIQKELGFKGFLYRYSSHDGLPGREGAFLLCSFWLVDCLIAIGSLEEAESLLNRLEGISNHLGLFSEQYDPDRNDFLGNFPQAFTHIGYVNSAIRLLEARRKTARAPAARGKGVSLLGLLVGRRITLNEGPPGPEIPAEEMGPQLKSCMNILRGAFFDTARGRVAYEQIRGSRAFGQYEELSRSLQRLNLKDLGGRNRRLAFWINLYNVLVIHGVIELGIRDSVKEVRDFFGTVQYRIDELFFTPQDIEHGIMRGNRRPPHRLFKSFKVNDPRLEHSIRPVDPRIHFALVCASSSCPPIDVYTPEGLDQELDISGRTFLNAGGIRIDRERRRVTLSKVFKWYGRDFGDTERDIVKFIAPYLYEGEDRTFLEENADRLKVGYMDYDWRLNRTL